MNLEYTPEEEAFREEVRAFLKEKMPARLSNKVRDGKHLTIEEGIHALTGKQAEFFGLHDRGTI